MQPARFKVERNGFPISEVNVKHAVGTGITYGSMSFPLWEAAIAAGATLDELEKLDAGGYPISFQAKLVARHWLHQLVDLHRQEAAARAAERQAKKRK